MWLIQNGNLTQIVVNPASTALTASSGRQIPWKPKLIPLLGFYTLSSEYILQTNETCWAFSIKYQKTLMARGPFHSLHSHSASFQLETNAACFLVFFFVHISFDFSNLKAGYIWALMKLARLSAGTSPCIRAYLRSMPAADLDILVLLSKGISPKKNIF